MLSTSFRVKTPTLYSKKNYWPAGPGGIFEQNLTMFFFFLGKDFLFVLGPLNMLSSICTKMLALYSKILAQLDPRAFSKKI